MACILGDTKIFIMKITKIAKFVLLADIDKPKESKKKKKKNKGRKNTCSTFSNE
jgi:hypothetical protein